MLEGSGRLLVRADYAYTSEFTRSRVPGFQRGNVTGTNTLEGGAFGLVNARLSYTPPEANWEVAVFGTNLTDEWYLNSGHTVPMWGFDWGTVGRPREFGAMLKIFID
jgi:iron complex outermembrane receptor protein